MDPVRGGVNGRAAAVAMSELGPSTDLGAVKVDVRSALMSRHRWPGLPLPKSAINRRRIASELDPLIQRTCGDFGGMSVCAKTGNDGRASSAETDRAWPQRNLCRAGRPRESKPKNIQLTRNIRTLTRVSVLEALVRDDDIESLDD